MEVTPMSLDPRCLGTTIKTTRVSYEAALAIFEYDTIRRVAEEMSGQDSHR
jgi:hypothetical protein